MRCLFSHEPISNCLCPFQREFPDYIFWRAYIIRMPGNDYTHFGNLATIAFVSSPQVLFQESFVNVALFEFKIDTSKNDGLAFHENDNGIVTLLFRQRAMRLHLVRILIYVVLRRCSLPVHAPLLHRPLPLHALPLHRHQPCCFTRRASASLRPFALRDICIGCCFYTRCLCIGVSLAASLPAALRVWQALLFAKLFCLVALAPPTVKRKSDREIHYHPSCVSAVVGKTNVRALDYWFRTARVRLN